MRLLKTFDCADCGTPTTRYRNANQPLICLECGVTRAIVHAKRLHDQADARYGVGVRPRGHGRRWLPRGGQPKPP